MGDAGEIIAAIRQEIGAGVDDILVAATEGLDALSAIGGGDSGAEERLAQCLVRILEACAFQDLTGQRLARLDAALETEPPRHLPEDPLLNGPALDGQGLDQAAADRLLSEF